MGQTQPAQPASVRNSPAETSKLPEETYYLVHDALRCFSLVQVMNGAIASAVTFLGYLYKNNSLTGGSRFLAHDVAKPLVRATSEQALRFHPEQISVSLPFTST